jgi:hypothetical protein
LFALDVSRTPVADLDRLVKLAKPITRRIRILFSGARERMIVNQWPAAPVRLHFVFGNVREIHSRFAGPLRNHFPGLQQD